jgi:hypothetical protein
MNGPNFSDLRKQFEQEFEKGKAEERPKHILVSRVDECTCGIYVQGTLAFLAEINQKEEQIHHLNDRTQVKDFPLEADMLENLSDMAGFPVTEENYVWEVAKGICLTAGVSQNRKFVPRYDMLAEPAYIVKP